MKRIVPVLFAALFLAAITVFVVSGATVSAGTKLSGAPSSAGSGDNEAVESTGTPILIPTSTHTPVPFPTGTVVCASTWYEVSSPAVSNTSAEFESIDGVSTNDMWAVGFYLADSVKGKGYVRNRDLEAWQKRLEHGVSGLDRPNDSTAPALRTFVQRWNGSEWTTVASPNVGSNDNHLLSIEVIAVDDAWAVGYYLNEFGIAQTMTLHWDGSAWTQVDAPSVSPYQDSELLSVEAVAPGNVWAAGYSIDDEGRGHPLIERWDGTQ